MTVFALGSPGGRNLDQRTPACRHRARRKGAASGNGAEEGARGFMADTHARGPAVSMRGVSIAYDLGQQGRYEAVRPVDLDVADQSFVCDCRADRLRQVNPC